MINKYWFYIEPYVNICINNKTILIYNTLNGLYKKYKGQPEIEQLFRKIILPRNNRVILLSVKEVNNIKINNFINDLKKIHAADLLKKEWSKKKPIQITPILNLQSDVEYFKKKEANWIGNEIMSNIYELSLYLNNFSNTADYTWEYAYKQILIPYIQKKYTEIPYFNIFKILTELSASSLSKINILGGNIFLHSEFNKIINLLNNQKCKIFYHFNCLDLLENINKINLFNKINSNISLCISGKSIDFDAIKKLINILKGNILYKFVIEDENNLINIENLINELGITNFSIHPLYNGNNLSFFKKNVYTIEGEILENRHSQIDIFQKGKINTNFFGKITIMGNEDIYANLNENKLGNLKKDTLLYCVYKEMYFGKSWMKTRTKVLPCKNCIYNLFCPPISNYEYIINKNNLCSVKH